MGDTHGDFDGRISLFLSHSWNMSLAIFSLCGGNLLAFECTGHPDVSMTCLTPWRNLPWWRAVGCVNPGKF